MTEHLSKETATRLLSRELRPDELMTASRHLSSCAECRQLLGVEKSLAASAKFLANDLQEQAPAGDLHLNYEQLEGYVDELLPKPERERVSHHLATCHSCAKEVKELSLLRENLASYPQATPDVAATASPPGVSAFQRFAALFESRRWQLAGVTALLLLAAVVGLVLWQSRKQPQLANGPKDGQTKAPDAGKENPPANGSDDAQKEPGTEEDNKGGNSNGEPGKSADDVVVATAIATQTLVLPRALKDLNGRPVTLLGQSDPALKFDLLSPRGIVVENARPTLRWRALAGAESYKAYILNPNFDVVQTSEILKGESWTVSRPLPRGQTYIWQVVATKDGKEISAPVAPAKEARFKVLDARGAQAIQWFAQANQENHLALGIIYAHYGLLDEANRQLSSAAKLKQSPELARRFLRELEAMRR